MSGTNEMETTLQKQGLIDNSGAAGDKAREARAEASYQTWLKWVVESEQEEDAETRNVILWATKAVAVRKHAIWQAALKAKNAMIESSIKEHTVLPDNYWKAEHLAWIEYQQAYKLIQITEQELGVAK